MSEPSYYYTVNELLLHSSKEKLVSSTQFRAIGSSLKECKRDAEQFYKSRKERVDYWLMLGTYEIASYQTFELNISLVEIANENLTHYLIKSINKDVPQYNLEYEKQVLAQYPANVNNWRDANSPKERTPEQTIASTSAVPKQEVHTEAKKGWRTRLGKLFQKWQTSIKN